MTDWVEQQCRTVFGDVPGDQCLNPATHFHLRSGTPVCDSCDEVLQQQNIQFMAAQAEADRNADAMEELYRDERDDAEEVMDDEEDDTQEVKDELKRMVSAQAD
jgi:hypothetical protein